MFSSLLESIERSAEREEDEDDPIFGDGTLMNHTGIWSFDPTLLNLVHVFIESEETDV